MTQNPPTQANPINPTNHQKHPNMTKTIIFLSLLVCGTLADRYTDFAANKAWWTYLTSVDDPGYRRMCFVGTYDQVCDTSLDAWNKVTSFLAPTTNAGSYSGSVTLYKVCGAQDVNNAYYKLASGPCGFGYSQITSVYLITDNTNWAKQFVTGGVTYNRVDFVVLLQGSLDTHLIIPVGDLNPDTSLYGTAFTFSAYQN